MDGTKTNEVPAAEVLAAEVVPADEELAGEAQPQAPSLGKGPPEGEAAQPEEAAPPAGEAPPKAPPVGQKRRSGGLVAAIVVVAALFVCLAAICVYAFINGAESLPLIGQYYNGGNTAGSGATSVASEDAGAREPATETTTAEAPTTAETEETTTEATTAAVAEEADGTTAEPVDVDAVRALGPVAMLGDIPIEQYEFTYFMSILLNYYGESDISMAQQSALQAATEFKVLSTEANEKGVEFTAEDRQSLQSVQYDALPYYAEMAGVTEEEYVSMYFGVSLDEYFSIVEGMILNDRFTETLVEATDVSDEDTLAKYEADPSAYNTVTVRHILFFYEGMDPDNPRSSEVSKEMAESALQRVQAGEDFAGLVAELTEDTASVETGGEYTFTRNDSFVGEFMDWAFAAEVGDTGIVETDYGYHVMRLDAVHDTYDDFKDAIAEDLKHDAVIAQYSEWYEEPRFAREVNQEALDGVTQLLAGVS